MNTNKGTVGIIANPQSGKDIRRINAYGFPSNNFEKINIIQKVLLGLDSTGISEVFYMPESFGIVHKAAESLALSLKVIPLAMELENSSVDSTNAAKILEDIGTGCIITLGGDGTNRAVAKGLTKTPLLPISAGTNNVFPLHIDGTIAGITAGLFIKMNKDFTLFTCKKKISVKERAREVDLALIDAAVCRESFVGSKAIVDISTVKTIMITEVKTELIGFASIASFINVDGIEADEGLFITLSANGQPNWRVKAPIAPGLIVTVPISEYRRIKIGDTIAIDPVDSVIALDGEREIEVLSDNRYSLTLCRQGPRVLDIAYTIEKAKKLKLFK